VDRWKNTTDQMRDRFGVLSFNQKVLMGAVATASIISLTVFGLWLQKEDKVVLFSNLNAPDAALVLDELAKQDVEAELANGGTTIMVPENSVHRLRVDLAAQGIPSSGTVGFEIFDGKQYGLTEFLQNVNFKRALEGELTKSIESLQGIQSARVHLVLPKPSIFKSVATDATASVVVNLGRGTRMADRQIVGIQSLVAGSVENLIPEQVTVIDQNGKVLSEQIPDEETGRTETQLAMRQQVESYLAGKASSMLDRVLGPGRSVVQVDATLNFEKIERQSETYDPRSTVVRSEVRNEVSDPDGATTDENSTTNYEINRTVENIVGQTGGVESLSVAVFVDWTYQVPAGSSTPVYQPLTDEELGQLRRIVQTAVGLNAVRGDHIEVVNMKFQQPGGVNNPPQVGADWLGMATRYGGKAFLFLVFGVMALSLRRSLGRALASGAGPGVRRNVRVHEKDYGESFDGIPDMDDQMIGDIRDYASDNPERVADVVQSWIHEMEQNRRQPEPVGETREA